jgi:hypothetical protein
MVDPGPRDSSRDYTTVLPPFAGMRGFPVTDCLHPVLSTTNLLWLETYDRSLDNRFEVLDEIASAIFEALQRPLMAAACAPPMASATKNVEAYDSHPLGRYRAREVLKKVGDSPPDPLNALVAPVVANLASVRERRNGSDEFTRLLGGWSAERPGCWQPQRTDCLSSGRQGCHAGRIASVSRSRLS